MVAWGAGGSSIDAVLVEGELGGRYGSAPLGMVAWTDMNIEGAGSGLVRSDLAGGTDLTSSGNPAFVPCEY